MEGKQSVGKNNFQENMCLGFIVRGGTVYRENLDARENMEKISTNLFE